MAESNVTEEGGEPAQKDEQTTIDYYRGTAAAIVATGLIRFDQLPGQPGRDSARVFYRCGEPAEAVRRLDSQPDPENWMRVDRRLYKADFYCLTVGVPRADSLRRRAAIKARLAREHADRWAEISQREKAVKEQRRLDAERELSNLPASKADFLREIGDKLRLELEWRLGFEQRLKERGESFHGYTLSAAAVPEILEAFAEVQEAIERADVVFDRTLHQQVIAKRRHEIAAADENFQRHLALVATTAKPRLRAGDVTPAGDLRMVWSAAPSPAGGGEA